ncbi:TBC1 domain family member 4-like [Pogonomyrmex barbatus]|uniref:TBC1 domain family member 4-like n=1 Tax=Pogonomyrmex barbatus TaxID=144034 RepID=A0A6I9WXP1_9HYME|nr:TBC1 domain family member 4-like [Pogonomyrmex barbatus]XP_011648319.1 TBC1 domain family member 4-like [Pogonomyrmex barbatus]
MFLKQTKKYLTSESFANSNITVPEIIRNRAASTNSVLSGRRDSAIKGTDDHNRTIVFQVGRFDLRLISPDRKQVLLHKQLKDVASCAQTISASSFSYDLRCCKKRGILYFLTNIVVCTDKINNAKKLKDKMIKKCKALFFPVWNYCRRTSRRS